MPSGRKQHATAANTRGKIAQHAAADRAASERVSQALSQPHSHTAVDTIEQQQSKCAGQNTPAPNDLVHLQTLLRDRDAQLRIYAARARVLVNDREGVVLEPSERCAPHSTVGSRDQRSTVAAAADVPKTDSPPVREPNLTLEPSNLLAARGRFKVVPGECVGQRYTIRSLLGQGTFGVALECWDSELNKCCAMKIVDGGYATFASLAEIEIMERLLAVDPRDEFPLMKIQRYFANDQGHVCIVMNKYGPSLAELIKKHRACPRRQLAEIIFHCGVALDFFHSEMCMIHTDLKPENILLEADAAIPDAMVGMLPCRVRICDFGGSQPADVARSEEARSVMVSTRAYRAPEVILGLGWLYAADMWSMGCIIYELYTGRVLYETETDLEHLHFFEKTLECCVSAEGATCCTSLFDAMSGRLHNLYGPSRAYVDARPVRATIQDDQLVDLVTRLLEYDQTKRLTAREMTTHPFVVENYPDALLHPNHPQNWGPFAELRRDVTRRPKRPASEATSSREAAHGVQVDESWASPPCRHRDERRGDALARQAEAQLCEAKHSVCADSVGAYPQPANQSGVGLAAVQGSPEATAARAVITDVETAPKAAKVTFVEVVVGAALLAKRGKVSRRMLRTALNIREGHARSVLAALQRAGIAGRSNGDMYTPTDRFGEVAQEVPYLVQDVFGSNHLPQRLEFLRMWASGATGKWERQAEAVRELETMLRDAVPLLESRRQDSD